MSKRISSISFKPGDKVTWNHVPRGGYGYTIPVDAIIEKINAKTVSIRVKTKRGETKVVRVKPSSLTDHRPLGDLTPFVVHVSACDRADRKFREWAERKLDEQD